MSQSKPTNTKKTSTTNSRTGTKPRTTSNTSSNTRPKSSTTAPRRSTSKNYPITQNRRVKPAASKESETSGLNLEIIILAWFAGCVLLFISNFGLGGAIGNFVSSFLFGMFGFSAYIFPIYMFLSVTFYLVNKRNRLCYRKLISIISIYICILVFLHLLTVGYSKGESIFGYYKYCSVQKTGGGMIGGALSHLLCAAFGQLGAYVLIFILALIAVIILTQKSVLVPLKKKSKQVYKEAKEIYKQRRTSTPSFHMEQLNLKLDTEPRQLETKTDKKTDSAGNVPKLEHLTVDMKSENKAPLMQEFTIHRASQSELFPDDNALDDIEELELDDFENDDAAFEASAKSSSHSVSYEQEEKTEHTTAEKREKTIKNPKSSEKEISEGIGMIQNEIEKKEEEKKEYIFPPISLLKKGKRNESVDSDAHVRETALKLQNTLHNFGVNVTVTDVSCGPTVTRYELQPEQGVKVSRIVNLADDIKLNLAASDIRIEAPIPGKAAVGIEVPNATNSAVMLRDLLESKEFMDSSSNLAFAVGKDIAGKTVVADIGKMPHLLIAGATGSGKSVCINTLILSIIYKSSPEDVKLIMIDPKVVELSIYNGIPHLFIPVVTDPKKAAGALNWAVAEMTDRYNKFAEYNVRDLKGYNEKIAQLGSIESEDKPKKLPKIVIIVDELADLMMVAPGEVEDAICRLAQLARAAGIHLIIATQRPSVNVITGLIKANMPSRIAFSVASGVDSRTILDMNGAEKLLGKGDMLYYPQGYAKPARLQGSFVTDEEIAQIVQFLTSNHMTKEQYDTKITEMMNSSTPSAGAPGTGADLDAYFTEAGKFIIEKDKASIGMLQRVFKIGFNRAARIMDQLCEAGVVGPEEGTKPRKVLMTMEEFENYIDESL